VTLSFDLLTFVSGHTWRVTWSTRPRSLKILRLSVLELRVLTFPQEKAGHLKARFQGEGVVPLPIYWYHSKGNWMRYNSGADSFYIMKLCSRLFVPHCRSRPKDVRSRHFDPHFEEVRGGVEPWWMARWKARAEFLFSVIELLFLSLTVEALQGKTCQNSQPPGVGRSLWVKISGGRSRPWGICFGFYKTRHILLSNGANCTVLYVPSFWHNTGVWRTDGQTDGWMYGIAVANTALAMRALRAL